MVLGKLYKKVNYAGPVLRNKHFSNGPFLLVLFRTAVPVLCSSFSSRIEQRARASPFHEVV